MVRHNLYKCTEAWAYGTGHEGEPIHGKGGGCTRANIKEVMPQTLDISEARKRFNNLDRELQDRPVIHITRHGRKAFAVVDIEYLETIMETMEVLADKDAMALLERSVEDIQAGRVVDHDDLGRELGLAETDSDSVD